MLDMIKVAAWALAYAAFDSASDTLAEHGSDLRFPVLAAAVFAFLMLLRQFYLLGRREIMEDLLGHLRSRRDFVVKVEGDSVRIEENKSARVES